MNFEQQRPSRSCERTRCTVIVAISVASTLRWATLYIGRSLATTHLCRGVVGVGHRELYRRIIERFVRKTLCRENKATRSVVAMGHSLQNALGMTIGTAFFGRRSTLVVVSPSLSVPCVGFREAM